MNPQFYIVLTETQEKELFSYIIRNCDIKILMPLVVKGAKCYEEGNSIDLNKYMLVTSGNSKKITYAPFYMDGYLATEQIQGVPNIPYIEYWREKAGDQIVARIWTTTIGKPFVQTQQLRKQLKMIKEWIQGKAVRKEKLDGILQVYSLTGEIPTPDAGVTVDF